MIVGKSCKDRVPVTWQKKLWGLSKFITSCLSVKHWMVELSYRGKCSFLNRQGASFKYQENGGLHKKEKIRRRKINFEMWKLNFKQPVYTFDIFKEQRDVTKNNRRRCLWRIQRYLGKLTGFFHRPGTTGIGNSVSVSNINKV